MKSKLLFILLFCAFYSNAQYVNIPDSNFRKSLKFRFPECFNGELLDTTCAASPPSMDLVNFIIDVQNQSISNLEGIHFFKSTKWLDCHKNNLTELPRLPSHLTTLNCSENSLTAIDSLPSDIVSLGCQENNLKSLPNLPKGLEELYCFKNQLSSLPELPKSLKIVICENNIIEKMPLLPNKLVELHCAHNKLSELPTLPDSLTKLDCSDNKSINCISSLPAKLTFLNVGYTNLFCLPNLPSGIDPTTQYLQVCNLTNNSNNCQLITGDKDDYSLNGVTISYPNPVENGRLFVSNAQGLKYKLNTTQGQLMMNGTIDETGLDVSQLNSGMYMLEIGANENRKVEKIVIR